MWVEHSFGTDNGVQHGLEGVQAHFLSLRDGRPLTISMRGTQVTLHCSPHLLLAFYSEPDHEHLISTSEDMVVPTCASAVRLLSH